jgi:Reverse transcriptase (RNA-dependent DNA polymerase)
MPTLFFFHKIASSNRRCQQITSLDIDNVPCTNTSLIKSHVFSYYKSMLGTKIFPSAFLDAALWSEQEKVSPEENAMLCVPFSSEEIHKALFQMNPNKAPGPDGFSVLFYQTYLDLIKEDIVSMFNDFHCNNFDISHLNCALICLIPKINDPTNIKQFRPISVLNCSYKFFSKVLANRLYPVLDRLIGPNQLAFLKGHYILDAVVTAHEVLHHVKLHKEQGILLKLDFEKAFDNVNWSYIL